VIYLYKNVAYNFEVFEEPKRKKSARVINLPADELRAKKQSREKLLLLTKSFCILIASGMVVGSFIFGQANLTEYTHQISISLKELEDLKSRNAQLNIRLVSKEIDSGECSNSLKERNSVEMVNIDAGDKAEIK